MSDEMGTTTTVPTESKPRLAGTEQVTHTPGPFHITTDRGPDAEFCFHSIRGDDGLAVASTWSPDSEAQSEADAKLFAAAPEMLAALRTVGTVLAQRPITKKDDELWAAFSHVVAAVTKAMGGKP